jgi:hypothetical protein
MQIGSGWPLRKRDKHKQYKAPWLFVSLLPQTADYVSKIGKCYNARMQIEESFRDQKSIPMVLVETPNKPINKNESKRR